MNTPDVTSLHRTYGQLTGWMLTLSYMREWAWAQFIKRGFTEADLVKVVTWLRGEIRKGTRNPGALKFHNLIEDPDRFEEELAMSGMRDRQFKELKHVSIGKLAVMTATGRREDDLVVGRPARPVSDLIADLKRAAGMKV